MCGAKEKSYAAARVAELLEERTHLCRQPVAGAVGTPSSHDAAGRTSPWAHAYISRHPARTGRWRRSFRLAPSSRLPLQARRACVRVTQPGAAAFNCIPAAATALAAAHRVHPTTAACRTDCRGGRVASFRPLVEGLTSITASAAATAAAATPTPTIDAATFIPRHGRGSSLPSSDSSRSASNSSGRLWRATQKVADVGSRFKSAAVAAATATALSHRCAGKRRVETAARRKRAHSLSQTAAARRRPRDF